MKTTNYIIIATLIAMLVPVRAGANVYEDRLKTAFDDIINAVSLASREHMLSIYSDPETGIKEGQLDVYKFTIDCNGIDLINDAKRIYEQISDDLDSSKKELYVLWWNDNDRGFQGYRLYYNPEDAIVVGLACDHCYTVGFVAPDDKKHRKTYTIEWDDANAGDSITGRLITTYAPIKAKAKSDGLGVDGLRVKTFINTDDFDKWIEQIQAEGMEKYQIGMEKAQAKLDKAQDKLDKALSKSQSKSSSYSSSFSSSGSSQVVKGQVIDTDGEPLIGATIQSVGGGNTTYTDMNGRFSLILPNNVKQLKVSYIGYNTQVLSLQPNVTITLTQDNILDQPDNELSDLFLRKKNSDNSGKDNSNSWMKKLLFYVEKIQQSGDRYLYLSKLYDLCKDTEGLDQTDLKIGMQQLASVYKQLKEKKKLKENELLFLESMVDLLESKIKN